MMRKTLFLSTTIVCCSSLLNAAEPDVESFTSAAEILQRECIACHGHELQMAGLRLDTRESAMSVIEPGDSKDSLLIQRMTDKSLGLTMPPTFDSSKLPQKDRDILIKWIDEGAKWPKKRSLQIAPSVVKHQKEIKAVRQQIRRGDFAAALKLIDAQTELINASDRNGSTLLHAAAIYGNAKFVKQLLDREASVNAEDYTQITPLMLAVHDAGKVKVLLDAGADHSRVSQKDRTALELASSTGGNANVIELLLSTGPAPPVSRIHQSLHQALRVLDLEMVKLLLNKGGEFRIPTFLYVGRAAELDFLKSVIDLTGEQRRAALDSALAGAAQESSVEVVEWLIEQGADPSPALVQAAYSENTTPNFVQKFLDAGARVDHQARVITNVTSPLAIARRHADPAVVKLLQEAYNNRIPRTNSR